MLTVAPGLEMDVERGPDWLLVRIHELGSTGMDVPLADQLWELMRQHLAHRLVLELDEVEVLDDAWLEQLNRLSHRIKAHDGVLRLCGLSPASRKVLHASQLDKSLPPYEDRRDAVMAEAHWLKPR